MARPPYALSKSDRPDPIPRNAEGEQAEEARKEELSKAPLGGSLIISFLSSFSYMETKEMLWEF